MTSITPLASTPTLAPAASVRAASSNDTSPAPQAGSPASTIVGNGGGSFSTSVDQALGITVLKFFSSAGDLTQSFPSQKQLASYQLYGLGHASTTSPTPTSSTGTDTGSVSAGKTGATSATPAPGTTSAIGIAAAAPKVATPAPAPVVVASAPAAPHLTAAAA